MAKFFSEHDVRRRVDQGYGQGTGGSYQPWLKPRQVPSSGKASSIPGRTTGRLHCVLSGIEADVFYLLDWMDSVTDIREQYPLLGVEETKQIADELGIRHPAGGRPRGALVQTTDFLITVSDAGGFVDQAIAVKPSSDLDSPRILELLEIERRYWEARNISWSIVTEADVPEALARNLGWLSSRYQLSPSTISINDVFRIEEFFAERIDCLADSPLTEVSAAVDDWLGLERGCALNVARQALARKWWSSDLGVPIGPEFCLSGLTRNAAQIQADTAFYSAG